MKSIIQKKQFIILTILFILILSSLPFGFAKEDIHTLNDLTVNLKTVGEINIVPTLIPYNVKYIKIWLYSNAKNDFMQEILDENIFPSAEEDGDALVITWNEPSETKLNFQINKNIKIISKQKPIKNKILFPLANIPEDVIKYTQFTDHIDNSADIQDLANRLAQNEDDLFLLENKIASWVNENIEYNLSTLNSEANIASSQVLRDRNGVCDEITNLFISINRALGIPARFVSGIAHTDSTLFSEPWGNHGWAEIYYPTIGWVPYDVTYDQFAIIDPTHITLQRNIDGTSASIKYKSLGNGFKFGNTNLETKTTLIHQGEKKDLTTSNNLSPLESKIAFGSYDLIQAVITNKHNYYQSKTFTLANTDNMKIIGNNKKQIALKPLETKTINWIIKIDDGLDSNYIYTFPITIQDELGYETSSLFKVDANGVFLKLEDLKKYLELDENNNLIFSCTKNGDEDLQGTTTIINCDLSKISSDEFPLKLCLETNCITTNNRRETFELTNDQKGIKTYTITAEGRSKKGSAYVTTIVLDVEKLNISNIQYPEEISTNEDVKISFVINKESLSNPKNVKIKIISPLLSENWSLDEVKKDQEFELTIPSNNLAKGNNEFKIIYEYVNNKNKKISDEKIIVVKLTDVDLGSWPEILINTVNYKVNSVLNKEQDSSSLVITFVVVLLGLFIAIRLIHLIFRLVSKLFSS